MASLVSLDNLVPQHLIGGLAKKTIYEVLLFYTQHEYDTTNTEAESKKRIYAKFRDYGEALAYAEQQVSTGTYYKVILRA